MALHTSHTDTRTSSEVWGCFLAVAFFGQNSSGGLGDVGDGGRLRCLHGKVDTTISCVCTCIVGSAQCSGCVVYNTSAMAAI